MKLSDSDRAEAYQVPQGACMDMHTTRANAAQGCWCCLKRISSFLSPFGAHDPLP
jgi:hypothetical protein